MNRDLAEPFATEQGLLNVLLYLPVGFFGLLATRRPTVAVVSGPLLSVATELGQALAPWVGRNCDTSDVQMNSLGTLIGFAFAWVALLTTKQSVLPWLAGGKRTGQFALGVVVVAGLLGAAFITPIAVDATSIQLASSDEKEAAEKAIRDAFGNRYEVANVQLQPIPGTDRGSLMITFAHEGTATLSWPDAINLNVSLESSSVPGPNSFPVSPDAGAPKDGKAATEIAQKYAQQHFPWALQTNHHTTHPVGDKAELGWITSWRQMRDGVLMPRSLDVQVNRAGRVSQIDVQRGPGAVTVPPRRITTAQAEELALRSIDAPATVDARAIVLRAVQRNATWRAEWVVRIPMGDAASDLYVDAETGKVHDAAATG
ncbi:VanZ family protein [Streptomyces sp. NRRL S-87]|uniref:VanZ family protein n=1 Tax=Streptomyces sp. NRRL S-87 TaxID=1463920 RepID=UPI00131CD681|nr:VanZ family protein [Streptomyces sp. NRRL S-87]